MPLEFFVCFYSNTSGKKNHPLSFFFYWIIRLALRASRKARREATSISCGKGAPTYFYGGNI